jgi:hypothetical protein
MPGALASPSVPPCQGDTHDPQSVVLRERSFENGTSTGLIAQDVERLFPELVTTDDKGFKMVNYGELPYLTLAAVTELHAQEQIKDAAIRDLKAENAELKARLDALEKAVAALTNNRSGR